MLIAYIAIAAICFASVYWMLPDRFRIPFVAVAGIVTLLAISPISFAIYVALLAFILFCLRRIEVQKIRFWFWAATVGALAPLVYFKVFYAEIPLGLSYFTLTLLGFFYDSYRGQIPSGVSSGQVLTFTIFLPIVPMGPIERFNRLSKTLFAKKIWSHLRASEGVFLIALGLFKKFVVADRLSDFVVDAQRNYLHFAGFQLWFYLVAALIQIFCDFSGFIDIVRGFSKLLGIEILDNFDQPYFARSIPDTWRRWHISLVDWLRDFLYNPIALKTKNLYLASGTVMLAVGMWHDVSWNRFFWAMFWTALFSISVFMRRRNWKLKIPTIFMVLAVCAAMALSTLFFLPKDVSEFKNLLLNLIRPDGYHLRDFFATLGFSTSDTTVFAIGFVLIAMIETLHRRVSPRSSISFFIATAIALLVLTAAFGVGKSTAFIYLRF